MIQVIQVVQVVQVVRVARTNSLDDMHSENIWFSWYKLSKYREKLICHACDGRTDGGRRQVENRAVFCWTRNRNYQKLSLLLAVCCVLRWERKHVSNLCMAEGSANTKVVLYCWAHHCQVLTSQGITQGITEPPNFQLFAINTAKAIYSRTNYFLSFF